MCRGVCLVAGLSPELGKRQERPGGDEGGSSRLYTGSWGYLPKACF